MRDTTQTQRLPYHQDRTAVSSATVPSIIYVVIYAILSAFLFSVSVHLKLLVVKLGVVGRLRSEVGAKTSTVIETETILMLASSAIVLSILTVPTIADEATVPS